MPIIDDDTQVTDKDIFLIRTLGRCITALERRLIPSMRSAGLTLAQFTVLELLSHSDGLTVSEIISKSFGTSGNIDVVIRNLLKLGWVQKNIYTNDKRVRTIISTQAGKAKINKFLPGHFEEVKELLHSLNEEEKEHLSLLLRKLTKGVSVSPDIQKANDRN